MRLRDALRALLVVAGLAVVGIGVDMSLAWEPPPPGTDGLPAGFAAFFILAAYIAGLFLVVLGVVLTDSDDPFFRGRQRTALRLAGFFLAGTVVVALVAVLGLGQFLLGVAVIGVGTVLVVPVVLAVVGWRVVEALIDAARDGTAG